MKPTFGKKGTEKLKVNVTPVTSMSLEDWLLEGETIRFSAYDSYSKAEITVTDRRLIFYRSSLTREEIDAYNLSHIAGYKIIAVRRIELTILGVILLILGMVFSYAIYTEAISIKPVMLGAISLIASFSAVFVGFSLIIVGLLSQQSLELTIAGRKIVKPLKLPRSQLTKLAKSLQA